MIQITLFCLHIQLHRLLLVSLYPNFDYSKKSNNERFY
mgnify:CR=1 FL=1